MNKDTKIEKLTQGRLKYQEKLRNGEIDPTKRTNPRERWLKNKRSLRASVDAFCFECVGDKIEEVRHCTAVDCPLYYVRPYQER